MSDTYTESCKIITYGASVDTQVTAVGGVETCGTYRIPRVPFELYSNKPLRRPKRQLTGERLKELAVRNPPPP